jgi:hypothetical protein
MSSKWNPHASTFNFARRLAQASLAGGTHRIFDNNGHRLRWGGWILGSTARQSAESSASTAVAAALAPVCVDKFQHAADATASLAGLKKVSSWEQSALIEKGGWATMPGSTTIDPAVVQACAHALDILKQAEPSRGRPLLVGLQGRSFLAGLMMQAGTRHSSESENSRIPGANLKVQGGAVHTRNLRRLATPLLVAITILVSAVVGVEQFQLSPGWTGIAAVAGIALAGLWMV